ncbi:5-bromo-4-chloroindolyl phosphate hydrolysis family protein [Paenibacillus sp. WQ 127069]|uniref:5-bromo-4-chloroindolyl phosphate hydrolysis family protein n=1 Tax=Paenibacillus baimaensis TaxID=2982185 RepID=A0ABT2US17_9BACL|nr:5-bromo-4-chloroindolyl phosphate hydrolysis family protein [Paenibacillus sp. WQ 127069]MCU6797449.1 5-bromo-4-chloroindolyl phosphate hydrolysis family protein [Paenibacillus sp. WQ 127069]
MISRLMALPQFTMFLSLALCSGAFVFFMFVLDLSLVLSLVLGVILYVGLHLILTAADPAAKETKLLLRAAKVKLELLRSASYHISNPRIQNDVNEIVGASMQIMLLIQKKSADLPASKQLLTFYLDNTLEMVNRYVSLSSKSYLNASSNEVLRKIEEVLEGVKVNFIAQYNKLLINDLSDLAIKMDAVSQMLEWEDAK